MRSFWIFLLLVFSSGLAGATEMIQFGENTRSFGMGGVRVMDPNAAGNFLWNPAALGFVKGMNWQIFDIDLGVNGIQAYNDFKDTNISGISSLSSLYGKHLWVGGMGYSAFTLPNFGVAVWDQALLDLILHNPAYPQLNMTYLNDYAFAIGGAVPIGPAASLGLSAKRITRLGGPQVIGPSILNSSSLSSTDLLNQFQNQGIAYGLDTGIMVSLPAPFSPTLSIGWQDIGDTAFTKSKGSEAPAHINDNLTAAVTFSQDIPLAGISGGIEYRHINDANEQLGKKLHMGLELSLLMFDLRAGFYQGYYTYGFGMDLWLMQLDAAMYTVERGAYTGQTPDQRIQVGLNMSFGFDPDFKLTDSSGRKRKFKQRR